MRRHAVFWWFERGGDFLRCEAQRMATGGYELRIIGPDGSEQVEHFTDSQDLTRRQHAVIDEVTRQGWSGPHGWIL
jgi:hypothetical protein